MARDCRRGYLQPHAQHVVYLLELHARHGADGAPGAQAGGVAALQLHHLRAGGRAGGVRGIAGEMGVSVAASGAFRFQQERTSARAAASNAGSSSNRFLAA